MNTKIFVDFVETVIILSAYFIYETGITFNYFCVFFSFIILYTGKESYCIVTVNIILIGENLHETLSIYSKFDRSKREQHFQPGTMANNFKKWKSQ